MIVYEPLEVCYNSNEQISRGDFMLRVAVAEDEKVYSDKLKEYLERYGEEHSMQIQVDFFETGLLLTKNYQPIYDIILLDIKMPDMDGMEAAELIRQQDEQVVLVFITQMAQYAIHGYEVGALDFLLKPVGYETFQVKFTRAIQRAQNRVGGQIALNLTNGMKRIRTRDIYYVEIQNHILHYHTASGDYEVRGTMQSAEQQLANYHFAKCNHWYLVNLAHVSEVNKAKVVVAGKELEISRRSRTTFLEATTNYLGGNT